VLMGLPRAAAIRLAAQTMLGAARMVLETGKHTGTLRDEVTSPGGTTAAGLEALELGGLRAALQQAVRCATERAEELGRK
jgi:pyrroline-5-carboxylate reductase